jgi:myo-inositol-1(or 4)-monophosphatase
MPEPLGVAQSVARAAGDLLRRRWPRERAVSYKGLRDIVTDADLAAQTLILDRLRAEFPNHALLAEESQHDLDLAGPTPLWVIDPLDGTTNYSRRFPVFSVSVALAQSGELLVGAIYDPLRREMFYAQRGQGAWRLSGRQPAQPLRVSGTAELIEAVVGVDWARDPRLRAQTLAALTRIGSACRTVRSTGSAALALAYVAMGRTDAYYHLSLMPWDVAAGALIIQEAGGTLTTPAGAPWRLGEPAVLASNGLVHAELMSCLALPLE